MNYNELADFIQAQQSFLIVGLDTDIKRIPPHLLKEENPILAFNKAIIEATKDLCVGYKVNTAFYEALGAEGWDTLAKTSELIPDTHFGIADAKRADIGNTSKYYAKAVFEHMNFDSITVAPYMGSDSVQPFLSYEDKWVILLALTSNQGSNDFQFLTDDKEGKPLFEHVMNKAQEWGTPENLMFVTGATHPEKFKDLRAIAPKSFFLVPGVGAQGGDLEGVCRYGMNDATGLLINSSRGIIYAWEKTGDGENFAQAARESALALQQQMAAILKS